MTDTPAPAVAHPAASHSRPHVAPPPGQTASFGTQPAPRPSLLRRDANLAGHGHDPAPKAAGQDANGQASLASLIRQFRN